MVRPYEITEGFTDELTIAILAGGRSSRMGRDKRFICLAGRSFLDRAVDLALAILGGHPERVLLCGDIPGRQCIRDERPGLGPIGGVFSAVQRVGRAEGSSRPLLLVMPVDMPLLAPTNLDPLLREARDNPTAAAVRYRDFEMPFVLRCDRRAREILSEMCEIQDERSRSVRSFLLQAEALEIPCPAEMRRIMVNMNSPSDLAWVKRGDESYESTTG